MSSEEIKSLRRKLKKARENGKLQEISDCCCNLAAYLSDEEEHEEALKLYKESLKACEVLGNKEGIALANRMIAEESTNLGLFDEALKHINYFLNYAKEENDKVEEQRGLVLKGHVYFTQAEFLIDTKPNEAKKIEQLLEQSMEAYRKSFAICNTELNDINERERLQMKARLLQNKSLVLSRQNKLEFAQAHLIRAIKICAKEKLNDTEHICYLSLGELYIKKGEPEKALHVFDKALGLSHSTQKKRDSMLGKARTYIIMENYSQAKATLKKAYKLRDDFEIKQLLKRVASIIRLENNLCATSDSEISKRQEMYKKLGDGHCALKNYKKAIKCYLNMLSCAQKSNVKNELTKCYSILCKAFIKDRQYDKALFYSHQEVESVSKWAPEKACKTLLRVAKLHELNNSDFDEIQCAFSRAKTKAKQFNNQKLYKKSLKNLVRIGNTFGKLDLVQESENELKAFKADEDLLDSSSDSGRSSDSDLSSTENENESSDTDIKDILSDSDIENEEYDRPKERCKRTKFTIKRNEKGETDLHVAAIKGNYKKVKQLIDQGHPVNVRDTAGWTPLHEACNHGYVDIVNILLDFGADINDKGGPMCDGTTPLHDAAINGQLTIIETLIKRGASTLVLNDASETPLQCLLAWKKKSAMDADEEEVFQRLVEALKSPLDSEDIKKHLKTNSFDKNKTSSSILKSCNDIEILNDRKTTKPPKPNKPSISDYRETIDFFSRKKHPRRDSLNSDSDRSDEEDSFEKLRRMRNKKKSACDVYREAIDNMRHKPKKMKMDDLTKKSKPALIDEKEYVDNCIMDDDGEEYEIDEEEIKALLGDDFEEPVKKKKLNKEDAKKKIEEKPKKQTSVEKELRTESWLNSNSFKCFEDSFDSTSKQITEKNDEIEEVLVEASKFNVIVNILNKTLNISVDCSEKDKLKLDWLLKEVAKQQPAVQNADNFISVKVGGVMVEESNTLSQLANKEVEIVVRKWKSMSLSERYETICTVSSHPDITAEVRPLGFKHSPHPQVVEILKKSNSRCLTLSNLKLSSLTLIPICKALKYESFIENLNLSNNYFGDKGLELIVKIFERCIIEELNVSGCNITCSGIYHFSDALSRINELSRNGMEVLNLGFNPITDDAIAGINNIVEQLPNLRTLYIDHCELEMSVSVNNSTSLVIIQGEKFESPTRCLSIKTERE